MLWSECTAEGLTQCCHPKKHKLAKEATHQHRPVNSSARTPRRTLRKEERERRDATEESHRDSDLADKLTQSRTSLSFGE